MASRRNSKGFNEREMMPTKRERSVTKSILQEGPANNPGIKPNINDGEKYNFMKDKRLRSIAAQIATMLAVFFISGKFVQFFVNRYVMSQSNVSVEDLPKGGDQNYKLAMLKGEEFSKAIGGISIYKTESALTDELENLQ